MSVIKGMAREPSQPTGSCCTDVFLRQQNTRAAETLQELTALTGVLARPEHFQSNHSHSQAYKKCVSNQEHVRILAQQPEHGVGFCVRGYIGKALSPYQLKRWIQLVVITLSEEAWLWSPPAIRLCLLCSPKWVWQPRQTSREKKQTSTVQVAGTTRAFHW